MDPAVSAALREAGVPFREQEPFARHTTMGVGGPAALMAFPRSRDELRKTLRVRRDFQAPHRILGGGSNLVVVDAGLDELVVNTEHLSRVELHDDGSVSAEGGANVIRTVVRCCRAGLKGVQSAVGIPGSVGGAAVMNAGAYGFSISDVMTRIEVLDADGEQVAPPQGWQFHYRGSTIPEGNTVASITLALERADPAPLAAEIRELQMQRVRSQPRGRNAGCVFKNPAGASAGRILDQVGLKGTRRGHAVISDQHANFVVNEGGATAAEVLELVDLARDKARADAGIALEMEVRVWRPRA